jgi:hypothetical protein
MRRRSIQGPSGWRAGLLFALAAAPVAGCGASSTAAGGGGSTGSGGQSGKPPCQISIDPVLPASLTSLVPGPGATVRLGGTITGVPSSSFVWQWSVSFADGGDVPFTHPNDSVNLIEFAIPRAGSYTVDATLVGPDRCGGERSMVANAPGARMALLRFRFVPPPGTVPAQEKEIQIFGATPTGGNRLALSAGTVVRFDPRDAGGTRSIPSYVRISDPAGRVVAEDHVTAGGGAINLSLAMGLYDLLAIPDAGADVAPALITAKSPGELAAAMPLPLDPGVAVGGTVSDDAGPIAGATVVLRAGARPSSLGTSGADGRFGVRAAPGTYGATITRRVGDGILEATLDASAGLIAIDGATAPPALNVKISQPTSATLTLPLAATDLASLGDGARVVVESMAPLLSVATVTFGAGGERAAQVRYRAERPPVIDGASGRASVSIAGLPPAHYRATVFPVSTAATDAVTVADDIDLTAATPVTRTISLGTKVALAGRLVPAAQTAGVQLTALDVAGDLPIAIGGQTQTGGAFTLAVSAGRTYRLRAQPGSAPGPALARAIFAPIAVGAAGAVLADRQMPSALIYGGTIVDQFLQGLGGTLVQAFCLASAGDCVDPEAPLAEAVTRNDGFFQLLLPDPGVAPTP